MKKSLKLGLSVALISALTVSTAFAATPAPAKPAPAAAASGGITGTQIAIGAAVVGTIALAAGGKGSSGTK